MGVVFMDCPHRKVVNASLFEQSLSNHIHITVLLNYVIIDGIFDVPAHLFDIAPNPLDIHGLVEGELLVNHTNGMICPHMIPPILR